MSGLNASLINIYWWMLPPSGSPLQRPPKRQQPGKKTQNTVDNQNDLYKLAYFFKKLTSHSSSELDQKTNIRQCRLHSLFFHFMFSEEKKKCYIAAPSHFVLKHLKWRTKTDLSFFLQLL